MADDITVYYLRYTPQLSQGLAERRFAMRNGFMKGVMVGGLVAASIGFMMNSDMMSGRARRKMIKSGRHILRKTGNIMSEVADLFR